MSFFLNFLFGMIRVLIVPWFSNNWNLGEIKYGLLNTGCTIGMFAGMLLLSLIRIRNQHKYLLYSISVVLFIAFINFAAWINIFTVIFLCFVLAFFFNIIFNTLLGTTVVLNTDENMRGKIASTKLTLCMAASPIGNFTGGLLGEIIEPRIAIIFCSFISLIIVIPFLMSVSVKTYMLANNS